MLPSKHSFKLLSKSEVKDIRLVLKLQKKNIAFVEPVKNPKKPGELTPSERKRAFLKLASVVGLGAVASLMLPKKAEALVFGGTPASSVVGLKNDANTRINPATEETVATILKTTDLDFDGSGYLNVNVQTTSAGGSGSFSDSGDVSRLALVDGDRHVQVDVLSSALPGSASTETTLQTIAFGGTKYALRMVTVGDYDYIGEAAISTPTSSALWRIKRIDNSSGVVITWAGTGTFDQVWDNYASLSYS